MTTKTKPAKPYKNFPLFAHANGQWCKKIRGRQVYFGKWELVTWQEALEQYEREGTALHLGRDPAEFNDGFTVKQLCNVFLTAKELLVESDELTQRSFDDYFRTCKIISEFFGKTRSVKTIRVADFNELRASLAKTRGKVALGNEINRIRVVFRYATLSEHLDSLSLIHI